MPVEVKQLRRPLKELVEFQIGFQLREGLKLEPSGTHQVVQAKDIDEEDDHALCVDGLERFTPERNVDIYTVRNGDIIFMSKGRRTYATVVRDLGAQSLPTIPLYYFFILRPRTSEVMPEFLAWVINETDVQYFLRKSAKGTTIPFVPKKLFVDIEINVPPLSAQEGIVRVHKLAIREGKILRVIQQKRLDLARALCLEVYRKEG